MAHPWLGEKNWSTGDTTEWDSSSDTDSKLTRFSELVFTGSNPPFFVFDRSGNRSALSPEHLANLWVSHSVGSFVASVGARYVDDQFLAEDRHLERGPVGLGQLARQRDRLPEAPEILPHRGARPGPRQDLVVFRRQHGACLFFSTGNKVVALVARVEPSAVRHSAQRMAEARLHYLVETGALRDRPASHRTRTGSPHA